MVLGPTSSWRRISEGAASRTYPCAVRRAKPVCYRLFEFPGQPRRHHCSGARARECRSSRNSCTTGVHVVCVTGRHRGGKAVLDPFFPTEAYSRAMGGVPDFMPPAARPAGSDLAPGDQDVRRLGPAPGRDRTAGPTGLSRLRHQPRLGNLIADTAAAEKTWSRLSRLNPSRTRERHGLRSSGSEVAL